MSSKLWLPTIVVTYGDSEKWSFVCITMGARSRNASASGHLKVNLYVRANQSMSTLSPFDGLRKTIINLLCENGRGTVRNTLRYRQTLERAPEWEPVLAPTLAMGQVHTGMGTSTGAVTGYGSGTDTLTDTGKGIGIGTGMRTGTDAATGDTSCLYSDRLSPICCDGTVHV